MFETYDVLSMSDYLHMVVLTNVNVPFGQVLQQQTEAIARLGNVLKRDIRDVEIIMAEETEMMEG